MAERIHWRPFAPFSYPIPSKGPTYRCFLLSSALGVCKKMRPMSASWSENIADVTCKRCLQLQSIGRFDTPETIDEVLGRGSEPSSNPEDSKR
jgi:hypothetical protein